MLDYFVAIGVALVGLLVVYFMFQSINKSDIVAVAAPKERKSRSRKNHKAPRREDTELDRETEALIAREVARHTASMRSDTRIAQPPLLETVRKEAASARGKAAARVPVEVAAKQMLIDKELGFQTVTNQPKAPKASPPQALQSTSADEEMDRKLGQFFSNNKRRDKKVFKLSLKEEKAGATTGAHVILKKDISNARTW
ncbi:hypothetical protein DQ04_03071020 [Trypanosoma grayi]|uniref:hypothetical protein n=1 Tax=Trypanosoma grayi TaxID=71804 RepID=UPI0004F466BE|nr:hypothetical protein DQ04_03071020 [Trypanosoma grayi]KEG10996.1 hypothetical protein DQ04_03071020 [Trypanosoma grayi]